MTITGGSGLSKDEIDRMMKDAEAHAEEDRKRRDERRDPQLRRGAAVRDREVPRRERRQAARPTSKTELEAALEELKKALDGADFEAIKAAQEKVSRDRVRGRRRDVRGRAGRRRTPRARAGAARRRPSPLPADDGVVDAEVVDEGPAEEHEVSHATRP